MFHPMYWTQQYNHFTPGHVVSSTSTEEASNICVRNVHIYNEVFKFVCLICFFCFLTEHQHYLGYYLVHEQTVEIKHKLYIWTMQKLKRFKTKYDDCYIDGRSHIKVHTDERTQVHSARSSLTVTQPSPNRGRRCL